VLAYDGTGLHGWQVQPGVPTVQGVLKDAATRLFGRDDARVVGASRTDAGVHALAQTVSLRVETALAPDVVGRALNATLPGTIRVRHVSEAPDGFDARRDAVGKRYLYVIDNGAVASPLLARYAWHIGDPLDVAAMRRGLRALRGRHDFSAFCAAPGRGEDPHCTVRALHVVRRRTRILVAVGADRLLHHMVRNVVGSAVVVGRGRRGPGWLAEVLASRDRTRAGATAPARGLIMIRALYPRQALAPR
jgi:tRNA pseudouridine38-40 synthase